jgi:hypothetical protein
MTTVCIFAPVLYHALETIGFHFQSSGSNVIFATRQDGDERSEHPWVLQRLRQIHEARSVSDEPGRTALFHRLYWKQRSSRAGPHLEGLPPCHRPGASKGVWIDYDDGHHKSLSLPRNMSRR